MTFNWDPLGKIVIELRADAGVAAIAGANPTPSTVRVAGFEPKPAWQQGPGDYVAHVVVVNLGGPRFPSVPVQRPRFAARCYGRTPEEAAQLGAAVSDALHYLGARTHANGLGIYNSKADSGGEQDSDPLTKQPFVPVFIDLFATTQAAA